jgi:cold shock protein
VKWFSATKGFGFIQPTDGGTDVFVHISAVERAGMRDLNEGQKISYDVVADRRRASRRRTISSRRDVVRLLCRAFRLVDTTRVARSSAKAQKGLATTSLSPSLPQLRL